MSFILDALRKSENSRLRQDHPTIFSSRIAQSRARLPRWVPIIGGLLAVNLLIVAYALWQSRLPPATSSVSSEKSIDRTPVEIPSPSISHDATDAAESPATDTSSSRDKSSPDQESSVLRAPQIIVPTTPSLSRDDLLARGAAIPTAELNMHVYDGNPAARFVLLNGQRLREGEMSREGLTVERITPEGVILRHNGASFAVNLQ